jgi:hypothetical protein
MEANSYMFVASSTTRSNLVFLARAIIMCPIVCRLPINPVLCFMLHCTGQQDSILNTIYYYDIFCRSHTPGKHKYRSKTTPASFLKVTMGQRLRENTPEEPANRSLTSPAEPERRGSAESTDSSRPAPSSVWFPRSAFPTLGASDRASQLEQHRQPTTREDTATVLNARRPAASEDQISEAAQALELLRHPRSEQQHQIIRTPEQQLPRVSQQQEDIRTSEHQPLRREDVEHLLAVQCTQLYSPYEIVHDFIPAYLDVESRNAWRQFLSRNTFLGVPPTQSSNTEHVTEFEPNSRSHLSLTFSNGRISSIERRAQPNTDNVISQRTNLEDVDDEDEDNRMVIVSSNFQEADLQEAAAVTATRNESLGIVSPTVSRTVRVNFVLSVDLPLRNDMPLGVDMAQGERLWMQVLRARARARVRARRRMIQRSEQ